MRCYDRDPAGYLTIFSKLFHLRENVDVSTVTRHRHLRPHRQTFPHLIPASCRCFVVALSHRSDNFCRTGNGKVAAGDIQGRWMLPRSQTFQLLAIGIGLGLGVIYLLLTILGLG